MPVDTMKGVIRQLIDIQANLYEFALKKTDAIKNGDIQEVGRLVELEKPLVEELREAERKRAEVAAQDVRNAGKDVKTPTFSEWETSIVPAGERPEWQALFRELAHSVFTLKQANQLNQDLLRQSLQWIRLNINLLYPQITSVNYGNLKAGQASPSVFSGRIDSRA
ncbi:flagellar protein FlgN [Sporolactobacillus putidus]|uniref:FlgN protein n=1 Tax=Sporolactobacillus putidus TaxID=492735 RepID=A0A917W2B3_9BACL|nr:flagellar protein FlgN [Sporolactobacillus putidus]GGL54570.1 hypothetical protein GCM10007968_18320 [Sporolactobacillus putidus]